MPQLHPVDDAEDHRFPVMAGITAIVVILAYSCLIFAVAGQTAYSARANLLPAPIIQD